MKKIKIEYEFFILIFVFLIFLSIVREITIDTLNRGNNYDLITIKKIKKSIQFTHDNFVPVVVIEYDIKPKFSLGVKTRRIEVYENWFTHFNKKVGDTMSISFYKESLKALNKVEKKFSRLTRKMKKISYKDRDNNFFIFSTIADYSMGYRIVRNDFNFLYLNTGVKKELMMKRGSFNYIETLYSGLTPVEEKTKKLSIQEFDSLLTVFSSKYKKFKNKKMTVND